MTLIDDFESGSLSKWTFSNYSIATAPTWEGTYAAQTSRAYATLQGSYTWGRGDGPLQWYQHVSGSTTGNLTMEFAADAGYENNYEFIQRSTGSLQLRRVDGNSVGSYVATGSWEWRNDDWMLITVDFGSTEADVISVTVEYQSDGTSWTISGTDTTYDTGLWRLGNPWGGFDGTLTIDYVQEQETGVPVGGTVTHETTGPLGGAKVTGINDTQGIVEDVAITAADGSYELYMTPGDTAHLLMEYDDGTVAYNAESKPFVVVSA